MFVKLYLVSIYAFLSFDCNVGATLIPAMRCMQIGWELCNIRQLDISPADRVVEDRSCFVDRGTNITIAFNFTPRFQAYNLKWSVWVETVIGDYKFEGVPPDARNLANYPTVENKLNQFQSVVHIPNNTRMKLWVVRVTLTGDTDKDVCCFLCEIRVRQPQLTTVVSSTDFDPTNPYDIIRKKVSYPTIWDFNEIVKNFQNDPNIFNKFVLNNDVTTPRPSYFSIIKNAFKRLLGFKTEMATISKVPFLGNASSLNEYFSGVIGQSEQNSPEQTIHNETEISTVNIEPECTSSSEIITEDAITEITTVPSTITETEVEPEDIQSSKVDSEQKFTDNENEAGSYEDDESVTEATTTTVKTTRTKPKRTIRISPASKKGIAKRKVSSPGIKKTVRPITKLTI